MYFLRGFLVIVLGAVAAGVSAYFAYYQPHVSEWVLLLAAPLAFGVVACAISPGWLTPAIFTVAYYSMEHLIVTTAIKPLGISVTRRFLDGDSAALAFPVGVAAFCWIALVTYRKLTEYESRTSEPLRGPHLAIIFAGMGLISGIGLMIGAPDPTGGAIVCLLIIAPLLYWRAWRKPAPPVKSSCYGLVAPAALFWALTSLWSLLLLLDEIRYTTRDDRVVVAVAVFAIQVLMMDRLRKRLRLLAGWSVGIAIGMILATVAGRYGWPGEKTWLAQATGKKAYTIIAIGFVIGPLVGLLPAWYWRSRALVAHVATDSADQPAEA